MYPENLKYTKTHEWVNVSDGTVKIGITAFAIEALTDLTFLEFNIEVDDEIAKGDALAEVESVKTTSQVYTPVSGKVLAINEEIVDALEDMMEAPYDAGWLVEIELDDPSQLDDLMAVEAYQEHMASEEH